MVDETAGRDVRRPSPLRGKSDVDPIVASWFDLILSRLCAEAAVETQRQWLRRNGESVLWSMPVPGS